MSFRRRFPVSAFILVVYLVTGVVGTGLHHHGEVTGTARGSHQACQVISRSPAQSSCNDSEGACAVCIALHHAKPLPTLFTFEVVSLSRGEVVLPPVATFVPPVRTSVQARGPPLV
jgi:hypothetical protein